MTRTRTKVSVWAAVAIVLAAVPAAFAAEPAKKSVTDAETSATVPTIAQFEKFMMTSSPICSHKPSLDCLNTGWQFADANKDGYLELSEVMAVRTAFVEWMEWKSPALPASQRTGVAIGILVLDTIGIDNIFAGLNTSGNGKLSRAELLADIKLDSRPLGAVLADPKAVDRKAIAARVGKFAPIVNSMLGGEEKDGDAKPAK